MPLVKPKGIDDVPVVTVTLWSNEVDVDSYMTDDYLRWHFEVDTEKATRNGIQLETITRNLDMAIGG